MSAQINLLNLSLGKQKLTFSAQQMVQLLGIVLLGVLGMSLYLGFQVKGLETQVASSQQQLKQAQDRLAKVTVEFAPRSKNKQLEIDITALETQVRALETVADLLKRGEFGHAKGYSSYLSAFARQSQEGLWLTNVAVMASGNEINLSGRTLQPELVPKYVQRLAGEPVLKGKSFARLEMQRLGDDPVAKQPSGSEPAGNSGSGSSASTAPGTGVASTANTPARPDAASLALLAQADKLGSALGQGNVSQVIAPLLKVAGVGANATLPAPARVTSPLPAPAATPAPGRLVASSGSGNSTIIEFHLSARPAEGVRK